MHKAIYLNIHTHVQSTKNRPLDSQAALKEVGQLIHAISQDTSRGLSLTVKQVRLENGADGSGVHVGILIYLEAEQEAASNFTTFATSALEKILLTSFTQPTPSGLAVTLHKIEENTNAVDELGDESDGLKN